MPAPVRPGSYPALRLPDLTTVSPEVLHAVASRHGIDADGQCVLLAETGIFNAVYLLGQLHVLRIPRNHPKHVEVLYREAIAVPAARQAGARTPALLVFDDTCDLVAVPDVIYERVRGETLAGLDLDPLPAADVWRELGRDLARVHTIAAGGLAAPRLRRKLRQTRVSWSRADPVTDGSPRAKLGGWSHGSTASLPWLFGPFPAVSCMAIRRRPMSWSMQIRSGIWRSSIWAALAWRRRRRLRRCVPLRAVPFMLQGHRDLPTSTTTNLPRRGSSGATCSYACSRCRAEPYPADPGPSDH
jgi:hypothetical protein